MSGRRAGFVGGVLWLMGLVSGVWSERPWYAVYEEALRRLDRGDAVGAVPLLQEVLRTGPKPGPNRPTYGMQFMDFFPYLYLARAYVILGDCSRAREALALSGQWDGLPPDLIRTERLPLEQRVRDLCSPPAGPVSTPPSVGPSEPTPQSGAPAVPSSAGDRSESPSVGPARRVPAAVLQRAWEAYLRGDYVGAQGVLRVARRQYDLDDVAYFLLGCSLAARYFREGERDVRLREEARGYFRRVRGLPAGLRQNLRLFISPKVLALYESE